MLRQMKMKVSENERNWLPTIRRDHNFRFCVGWVQASQTYYYTYILYIKREMRIYYRHIRQYHDH